MGERRGFADVQSLLAFLIRLTQNVTSDELRRAVSDEADSS